MPTNKNAQLRYQTIDHCLHGGMKYTQEKLLERVNDRLKELCNTMISRRQLSNDIKYMREFYGAPIVNKSVLGDDKRRYFYEDEDFTIFQSNLSSEDLNNLRSTIKMLGKYRGIPSNNWLEEVISNLEYRFGVKPNTNNIISFEQNEKLKGLEFLSPLIEFTERHQPVQILYRTYSGKEFNTIIHPYHIKQYNNRWFLFGLEEDNERITNRALDRIISIKPINKKYIPNTTVDFTSFFNDVIGVTVPHDTNTPILHITLKFDSLRFPYIVSKPIHTSQKIIDENERIVEITVYPNKELDALILSYGPQVKVISPESYRKQIESKIKANLNLYE